WVWMSIRPGATILPRASIRVGGASGDVGLDRGYLAAGDRHITGGVEPDRGIDDAPTLDDQFVAHLRECARGMDERRGCCDGSGQKLAPVHHGQFLPTLFGSP